MKLVPKYKHAGTLNKEWIKDRDINGNWGYRNFKTGQFRTTLPNSQEEKKQEQTKRNNAVLKTYSASKARYNQERETRKNHSDETVKKIISKPQINMDASGNMNVTYQNELAPGEDSAQLNTIIEEQIPIVKGFKLVAGLGKLALSKLGSNEVSHWARNSLINEAAGDIAKEATMGKALFKTNKSSNLETGTSAGKYADFYLDGDPYENYILRAKAKGATDEEINAILQINYNTPEGKKKLAQRLYEIDKKAGQIGDWEDPEAAKANELKLFKEAIKEGTIDWDTKGTAMPDYKIIHYDSNQLPTMSDRSFVRLHELEHALHYPAQPVPKKAINMSHFSVDPDYWADNNNTEIGARISQILSFMGIKDARKVTGEELRNGFEEYAATHQRDNSISGLRRAVTDWDALAEWANNPKNVYQIAAPIGISLPFLNNNENNSK